MLKWVLSPTQSVWFNRSLLLSHLAWFGLIWVLCSDLFCLLRQSFMHTSLGFDLTEVKDDLEFLIPPPQNLHSNKCPDTINECQHSRNTFQNYWTVDHRQLCIFLSPTSSGTSTAHSLHLPVNSKFQILSDYKYLLISKYESFTKETKHTMSC